MKRAPHRCVFFAAIFSGFAWGDAGKKPSPKPDKGPVSGKLEPKPVAKTSPGKEVIINNADWPPYFYGNGGPKGKKGIGREILEACVPTTGYTPKFNYYPIGRMVQMVKDGEIDLTVFGSLNDATRLEREAWATYTTETLFSATYKPITRSDSTFVFNSLNDFLNRDIKIGIKQGLKFDVNFDKKIEQRTTQPKADSYQLTNEGIEKLILNRINVFVETAESVASIAKESGTLDKIKIHDFIVKKNDYVVVISKKTKNIANVSDFETKLNSCIKKLKDDKTIHNILDSYGIKP